jgi:hypothetical protein
MQPRLQELFAYLKVRRNALREAVDAVPEAQRSQPPEPGRWSVASGASGWARTKDGMSNRCGKSQQLSTLKSEVEV